MIQAILKLFLIWKLWLWLVALLSLLLFKHSLSLGFLSAWTNWDGRHFIALAQAGYQYNYQFAFFPLYPTLIQLLAPVFGNNFDLTAIVISNTSLFVFLNLFYLYINRRWGHLVAWRTLLFLLFSPTAFFLNAAYSESIYLCLSMLTIYLADTKQWSKAWIPATLSTLTRFTGILNIFYLSARFSRQKPSYKTFLLLALSCSGLFVYMLYLYLYFHNPIWFIDAQTHWQRQTSITNPVATFMNYSNTLLPNGAPLYSIILDYLFTIIFLLLPIWVYRRVDHLLGIYSLLIILLPLLSGSLQSMPRYALSAWPVFILLGIWGKNRHFQDAYLLISLTTLSLLTGLFINHYWVA